MRVASQTPVEAGVAFLASVDDTEEKEIAAREHHPVAIASAASALVLPVGADDELAVAVPFDRRRRSAVGRALERHGIVARHRHVRRVFGDARRSHHAVGDR